MSARLAALLLLLMLAIPGSPAAAELRPSGAAELQAGEGAASLAPQPRQLPSPSDRGGIVAEREAPEPWPERSSPAALLPARDTGRRGRRLPPTAQQPCRLTRGRGKRDPPARP